MLHAQVFHQQKQQRVACHDSAADKYLRFFSSSADVTTAATEQFTLTHAHIHTCGARTVTVVHKLMIHSSCSYQLVLDSSWQSLLSAMP